jgi:hypothetical protein
LGKDADSHDKYQASKIFAERGKFWPLTYMLNISYVIHSCMGLRCEA